MISGCGPVTTGHIPDVSIIGTEPDGNIILDPTQAGLNFLTVNADTKFKVPQIAVEIVGKKDEWGWRKAFAKGVVESSYALHFYPHAYFFLIWDTEIGIYRVQRNIGEEKLEVYEEIIPFHLDHRPLLRIGMPPPTASMQGAAGTMINGVPPPRASDLSAKLQLLAQRVVSILLECHQNRNYAETACNDLRYLRGLNNPNGTNLAVPSSREGRRQAANLPPPAVPYNRGFKPIFDDRAVHPHNPHAYVNNFGAAAIATRQWQAPPGNLPVQAQPRDRDHVDRRVPPQVLGVTCPKCVHAQAMFPINATSLCQHLVDYNELVRRSTARAAGRAYNPWY